MDPGLDTTQRGATAATRPRASHGHSLGHGLLVVLTVVKSTIVAYLVLTGSTHAKWALSVLFAMLAADALVSFRRWRARRDAPRSHPEPAASDARVDDARRRAGIATAARIGLLLAFAGLLAASLALDLRYLGLGAIVAFLVLGLLGGPVWLAAIGDEEERAGRRA